MILLVPSAQCERVHLAQYRPTPVPPGRKVLPLHQRGRATFAVGLTIDEVAFPVEVRGRRRGPKQTFAAISSAGILSWPAPVRGGPEPSARLHD